jgi:hydrogenase large subunit
MAEQIQSDLRHLFLMFLPDFGNTAYQGEPLFEEAVRRYQPLHGATIAEALRETKQIVELVAILGGQWPHSSYMVPGGVTSLPSKTDLLHCLHLVTHFRKWYESRVLGCGIERWQGVTSWSEVESWLHEKPAHMNSELGFFLRYGRAIKLDQMGRGHEVFLSFGSLPLPEDTGVGGAPGSGQLVPAGVAFGTRVEPFDPDRITEHVTHSWFKDYPGGKHPFQGETAPYATGDEGPKYSWIKAPRYNERPAETGPLAEAVVAGKPLFTDLLSSHGASAFVRELARLVRPAELLPVMQIWIKEAMAGATYFNEAPPAVSGRGFGLTQACRGALGHWVEIEEGRIRHYQIITPTAWNGSPRDAAGTRGPWEEALIGTPVRHLADPVEVGHVVRSFDPCLVCAVHAVDARTARHQDWRQ